MNGKIVKVVLAAAILAANFAHAAQDATPIKLRFGHSGAPDDTQQVAALAFAKRVTARTNGAIEIQVFPSSMLGNDGSMLSGTRAGTIDMVVLGNPFYTGLVSSLNALDLPYQFDNAQHLYRVLDGKVGRALLDEFDGYQLKGLAFWDLGFRALANSKRPVRNAADIKGLKIRTTPNAAHIKAFQLLGASPQPMPWGEVYPALESKAIDGHETPVDTMYAAKMYEVQKYLSLTRHAYTALPVVMNKKRFDSLTPEQQKILVEEAVATATFQRDYNSRREREAIDGMRAKGVEVVEDPDIDSISKIVKDETRAMFAEKHGDTLLKAIDAAK